MPNPGRAHSALSATSPLATVRSPGVRALAITPEGLAHSHSESLRWVDAVLQGLQDSRLDEPSLALQIRDKTASPEQFKQMARWIHGACANWKGKIVLNGGSRQMHHLARELGLAGVHLRSDELMEAELLDTRPEPAGSSPASSSSDVLIGASCHSLEELLAAQAAEAHYAVIGPIFATPSKRRYGSALGTEIIEQATTLAELEALALLALGGIDSDTASLALAAGADGLAAIRSFTTASGTTQICNLVADAQS